MKRTRLLALTVCLLAALTQVLPQPPRLLAQVEADFSLLGFGTLTVETASLQKGSQITVETDLEEVAAIIVEDIDADRELVRLETERVRKELQARRKSTPQSQLVSGTDSLKGRFEQRLAYDLKATKSLRITIVLTNGVEIPLILTSRTSLANRSMTRTFNGKACPTFTTTCYDAAGRATTCSNTCCSDTLCYECSPCSITCGPCDWGGGGHGGCLSTPPGPQESVAVTIGRDPKPLAMPKSSFVLSRTEPGEDNISYLMDEWAVIAYSTPQGESKPRVEVLNASSSAFAAAKSRDLGQSALFVQKRNAKDPGEPRETLLIVEAPVHPHNSRFAPTPELGLSDSDVPPGMSPTQMLIRADFSDQEDSPQQLQVLHAGGPVPQGLMDLLRDRLELDRKAMKRHRTIAFAIVKIDDTIELTSLATVMPKCCCRGVHCI